MEEKKTTQGKKARPIIRTVVCAVLIVVLVAGMIAVNILVPMYRRMISNVLNGYDRSVNNSAVNASGLDLQYNKPDYTAATIGAAEDELADRIAAEGIVLFGESG